MLALRETLLRLVALIMTGSIVITPATAALAQAPPIDTSLRLTASPVPIRLVVAPGQSITTPLRVKNDGTTSEHIQVGVLKFAANDEEGRPKLLDPLPTDDFIRWVTLSETDFTIQPQEWKTITATFQVPADAAFGYYYAVVFHRAADSIPVASTDTALVGGTASLVLLEVRVPNAVRNIEVLEFTVDKAWYEFLPVGFRLKLRNSGNVHVAPRGNIFINRGEGKDIGILEVNEQQGSVLPQSNRVFNSAWTDGFPLYRQKIDQNEVVLDDNGEQVQELHWDFGNANKFRWGKYDATLLLVFDDGERDIPIEGHASFWVIPWRIMLALLVGTLILLMGCYSLIRVLWRKIFSRSGRRRK